jgi:hypothetical protein
MTREKGDAVDNLEHKNHNISNTGLGHYRT